MLTVVPDGCPGREGGKDAAPSLIDEIAREGARRMLGEALRAEVDELLAFCDYSDHWRVVNAPHPGALVRAGARSGHGVLIERPEPAAA
jgi:hypothetical protein